MKTIVKKVVNKNKTNYERQYRVWDLIVNGVDIGTVTAEIVGYEGYKSNIKLNEKHAEVIGQKNSYYGNIRGMCSVGLIKERLKIK
jgi:hypothetical protein